MYDITRLGSVIKAARVERKVSQEKLAEIIDITPTHLKHIESGHRKPSVEVLFAIFNALNISFEELKEEKQSNYEKMSIINALDNLKEKEISFIYKIVRIVEEESSSGMFGKND